MNHVGSQALANLGQFIRSQISVVSIASLHNHRIGPFRSECREGSQTGARIAYLTIEIEESMSKRTRDDTWRISMSSVSSWSKLLWNGNEVNLSILRTCSRSSSAMVDIAGMDMGGGAGDAAATAADIRTSAAKPLPIWLSTFSRMVSFCEHCNATRWVLESEENRASSTKLQWGWQLEIWCNLRSSGTDDFYLLAQAVLQSILHNCCYGLLDTRAVTVVVLACSTTYRCLQKQPPQKHGHPRVRKRSFMLKLLSFCHLFIILLMALLMIFYLN